MTILCIYERLWPDKGETGSRFRQPGPARRPLSVQRRAGTSPPVC